MAAVALAKKQRKVKRKLPKLGDPDYKTPTQLRNARKRRKDKGDKHNQSIPVGATSKDGTTTKVAVHVQDPSLRYLSQPKSAPIVRQAVTFFEGIATDFPITVGPTQNWRTVSKLAVRNLDGCLRIGLFVSGTHELLEVPQCAAHHQKINSAVDVLQKKCRHYGIEPFDEKTGTGNFRHVAINIERKTGRQQITLVWSGEENEEQKRKLEQLCDCLIQLTEKASKHPWGGHKLVLHSLWVHRNHLWKHSNNIFDRDGAWEKKYGEDAVVEHLDITGVGKLKVPLEFPPQVFRQANVDAFTQIIINIRSWLSKRREMHKHCLELYGGVGTIGLHLADLFETFTSSDENPFNKKCFDSTVSKMRFPSKKKKAPTIEYHSKNASDMVTSGALDKADAVIVDPPRKGLDDDVVSALCQAKPTKSLVYVSCGFEAFQRDHRNLTEKGGWKLVHAEGHVLFPGSDAIETVAFFERQ